LEYYSRLGARVAATDAADSDDFQHALATTGRRRVMTARHAAAQVAADGSVDLLIVPPPCGHDLRDLDGGLRPGHGDGGSGRQCADLIEHVRLVRPGGVIVVLSRVVPSHHGASDRIAPVMETAETLNLTYLQHNPIIHADLADGRITAPTRPEADSVVSGESMMPGLHAPVHSDLLVFIRPSGPAVCPDGSW